MVSSSCLPPTENTAKTTSPMLLPAKALMQQWAFLMDEDELQDLYADILGYGQKTVVSLGDLQ